MLLSLASSTSLVSSSGYLSVPRSIRYFLPCAFTLYLCWFFSCFPFTLSLPSLSFLSQTSRSSLCSSSCETQDPSQMGDLINSRLRVTHFGLERENECMHGQRNSSRCLPRGMLQQERKNPALGEQNTKAY